MRDEVDTQDVVAEGDGAADPTPGELVPSTVELAATVRKAWSQGLEFVIEHLNRYRAAEADNRRLRDALAGLESSVRVLDVMLWEPAAEGLMSAEDYRAYVQGAWLGVDEAAEKAREALAGLDTPADRQEDKT